MYSPQAGKGKEKDNNKTLNKVDFVVDAGQQKQSIGTYVCNGRKV